MTTPDSAPQITNVDAVNTLVADMGINASVSSLPESHQNVPAEQTAIDLAAESEATIQNGSSTA